MALSIGDIAARSGHKQSAIRYYEKEGLLSEPARRSGRRVYDPSILLRLKVIKLARSAGFGIGEIKELLKQFSAAGAPPEAWQVFADQKIVELKARVKDMQQLATALKQTRDCECQNLSSCHVVNGA